MPNENLVTTIEVTDEDGNVSTRDIVTYAGLLSKAHEQGLQRIETKIIQMPLLENDMTAICTATVTTGRGCSWTAGMPTRETSGPGRSRTSSGSP